MRILAIDNDFDRGVFTLRRGLDGLAWNDIDEAWSRCGSRVRRSNSRGAQENVEALQNAELTLSCSHSPLYFIRGRSLLLIGRSLLLCFPSNKKRILCEWSG